MEYIYKLSRSSQQVETFDFMKIRHDSLLDRLGRKFSKPHLR